MTDTPKSDAGASVRDLGEIDAEIDDLLVSATEDAKISSNIAPKSYRAGYNEGYRDALKCALGILRRRDGETP